MLYVCSELVDRVQRFEPLSGDFIDVFIGDDPVTPVDETGGLNFPTGIVFGPDGNAYVASFNGDRVLRYDGVTGAFIDVADSTGRGA